MGDKKLTILYTYSEGIGDTLMSIFDILSLAKHLKRFPEISIDLKIRPASHRRLDTLEHMLDLSSLKRFFDSIELCKSLLLKNGTISISDQTLYRIFSCNNDDITNSINGCFDLFCNKENVEYFNNIDVNYRDFILTLNSKDVEDFRILNKSIVKPAENFVESKLPRKFESIFYREFIDVDHNSVNSFIEKLLPKLDKTKTYFFCSNNVEVKKIFDNLGYNFIYFRPIDKHPLDRVPIGYSNFKEDIDYAVGDMIVLSYSSKIYSGISRSYESLFTFYPGCVYNIPVEFIPTL